MSAGSMEFFFVYVMPYVWIAIGAIVLIKGWTDVREALASRKWAAVDGLVRSSGIKEETTNDGTTVYGAEIRYDYEVDAHQYSGDRISFGSYSSSRKTHAEDFLSRYPAGSGVRVFYDPAEPSRSVLEPGPRPLTWVFLLAGIFAILISVTWLVAAPQYYPRLREIITGFQ